jgi:4-amino-4-deoxy-L-arabinose transferase-like glycosyltransferase
MNRSRFLRKPDPILLVSLLIAGFLLLFSLNSIPGLHGDEAWVGTQAYDIIHGGRPALGMNGYTGPAHEYLAAFFLYLFGAHVWSLRLFGVLSSLAAVGFYFFDLHLLFGRRIAAIATLLLVTMPFFVGFQRIANEVFMLNPLLSLTVIALSLKAPGQPTVIRKLGFYFLSGVLLGLGLWTHFIFISFIFSLACVAFFRKGFSFLISSSLYATFAGSVAGLVPRIIHQVRSHEPLGQSLGSSGNFHDFFSALLERVKTWPSSFLQVVNGDFIFERFSGLQLVKMPGYLGFVTILAGIGVLVFLVTRSRAHRSARRSLVIFSFLLMLSTLLISPRTSDRYFLLILYLVPIFIAIFFRDLLLLARKKKVKLAKPCLYGAIILLMALNLFRIGVNYFYSFSESGGRISLLWFGGYAETSNHYINTQYLYDFLSSQNASLVCAEFLISQPLEFYKLSGARRFDITWDEHPCLTRGAHGDAGIFGVVYKDGYRMLSEDKFPGFDTVLKDEHFVVLTPKKVQAAPLPSAAPRLSF